MTAFALIILGYLALARSNADASLAKVLVRRYFQSEIPVPKLEVERAMARLARHWMARV